MGKNCTIKTETCGFQCTSWDGKLTNGKSAWGEIKKIVKSIPCETCRDHGEKVISGVQDMVNVGLGEKPHDEKNFVKFVKDANCVLDKCRSTGRCK